MSIFTAQTRTTSDPDSHADPDSRLDPDSAIVSGESESAVEPAPEAPADQLEKHAADQPGRPGRRRRIVAGVATTAAALLVLFALIAPNQIDLLTPAVFVRLPVEGLLFVGLVLVLPLWARRTLAVLAGLVLGLLLIVKIADMGFYEVLVRPVDPVLDWTYLSNGVEFLTSSIGRPGALAIAIGLGLLAVALPVLMVLALLRLASLVVRHRRPARRALAVLGVAWAGCAVVGVQVAGGPLAASSAAGLAYDNVVKVRTGLHDQKVFAAEAAVDAFAHTPGDQLLTGLRGKDVIFAFVESYGRSAIEDPAMAAPVDAVLDAGTARLAAAGYASRSAFLTSPTAGGGSWLAHSTLLSGLWINSQQRYENLVTTDRFTLNAAFRRADWRSVAVMPGLTRAWPEGSFYGNDTIYGDKDLGYQGPHFAWAPVPDQFTLQAFQDRERSQPGHAPVMAEIPLVSSHAPWTPIPSMVDWKNLGNGSVFDSMPAAGEKAGVVWRDPSRVRTAYRRSIEYSLNSLISYVQKYGDQNLVLVFLGDHQPAPIVTGTGASRDVPITIVAKDPAVLDRVSGWNWQEGLNPDPSAPVWKMSDFRDRFLTAFH